MGERKGRGRGEIVGRDSERDRERESEQRPRYTITNSSAGSRVLFFPAGKAANDGTAASAKTCDADGYRIVI